MKDLPPTEDPDEAALRRLDIALKEKQTAATPPPERSSTGNAMRVAGDLVGGVVVGTGIGLWIDKEYSTQPFGLVICFLLGVAASARLMYQHVASQNSREP